MNFLGCTCVRAPLASRRRGRRREVADRERYDRQEEENVNTETQEEHRVIPEAETGVTLPQAKECRGSLASSRSQEKEALEATLGLLASELYPSQMGRPAPASPAGPWHLCRSRIRGERTKLVLKNERKVTSSLSDLLSKLRVWASPASCPPLRVLVFPSLLQPCSSQTSWLQRKRGPCCREVGSTGPKDPWMVWRTPTGLLS
ncbi:uncharacterized protein [Ovis canadensis]|uniref:uncharacterized protein n=1 Tax=Ovis canadensis TaxID=37174 RepID=UPI0037518D57